MKKATTGATAAFSTTAQNPGSFELPTNRKSQKDCGTKTEMKPAMVKPNRISFHTIAHSMEKAWAIRRQPSRDVSLSRQSPPIPCRMSIPSAFWAFSAWRLPSPASREGNHRAVRP